MLKKLSLFFFIIFVTSIAIAELYQGIGPNDTLGVIKSKYPGATIEKLNPAWAKPEDVLYTINGQGLSGTIVIKFYDTRPLLKSIALSAGDTSKSYDMFIKLAEVPDDSITVSWVRWVPDEIIPLTRFITKYGRPDSSGYTDSDYKPFRDWTKKGITASLSDDEKNVTRVDFSFTLQERYDSYVIGWSKTAGLTMAETMFFSIYPEAKGIIKRKAIKK